MTLLVAAGLMVGVIVILIGLAVYRLRQRPFSLERFRPQLENFLNDSVVPLHATVGDLTATRLGWSGIEITVRDTRLVSDDDHVWVSFAQVTFRVPLSTVVSPRGLRNFTGPWLFSGATVNALPSQAPFEALHGFATATGKALRFDIAGGRFGRITIGGGKILIGQDSGNNGHRGRRDARHHNRSRWAPWRETRSHDGPDDIVGAAVSAAPPTDEQGNESRIHADISFHAKATANDALDILSKKPFELIEPGILPASLVQGTVEADIGLNFTFDDLSRMEHHTRAEIQNLHLPKVLAGLNLTEGRFSVTVTNGFTTVEGAALLGGVPTTLRYSKPAASKPETLVIQSADIGALIAALNISGRLDGGSLTLRLDRPHDDEPWSGSVEVGTTRVLQAPLLTRLLTMASLPGLLSLLSSDGLTIDHARTEITIEPGRVSYRSIRISIDQLEITGHVNIALDAGRIDGEGLLIPAASLQRLVGAVPVLGAFLEGFGMKNTPVVATRFTLSGHLSEPKINVDPLSSLAPDILRDLGIV